MSLTGKTSQTTQTTIENDGFWPALSIGDLLGKYRIPSEYADSTVETGLILGMIRTNEALERVKAVVQEQGHDTFNDYLTANSLPVGGSELLLIHYQHAVNSRAKAHLLQDFKTINRREIAENEAKESEQTEKFWLDESAKSVASILRHFFPDETFTDSANLRVELL
ncbi:head completion/stabilization protein [Methylophaga sp. OBS4]|uniref:head completion/stabilization protein n=1 Tax=Methylophaga sp. OBS4 TaxID=2991935 RepID=UPI0022596D41|nr:head completion/stabilization protein [Methylophaga sp. OBS4]MCX4187174.1 head completion/stabilization protein [Methylophaga sp. OBS4]